MQVTFEFVPDIFFVLPVFVVGRVGDDAEPGIGFAWLCFIATVCRE